MESQRATLTHSGSWLSLSKWAKENIRGQISNPQYGLPLSTGQPGSLELHLLGEN
jgi:hypothetical protein